ncbi:7927_t:CDS:10 [Entrophospora sp. SA101]|nr:7927_t:CDS:10 [Entrophospora sp. SA101]
MDSQTFGFDLISQPQLTQVSLSQQQQQEEQQKQQEAIATTLIQHSQSNISLDSLSATNNTPPAQAILLDNNNSNQQQSTIDNTSTTHLSNPILVNHQDQLHAAIVVNNSNQNTLDSSNQNQVPIGNIPQNVTIPASLIHHHDNPNIIEQHQALVSQTDQQNQLTLSSVPASNQNQVILSNNEESSVQAIISQAQVHSDPQNAVAKVQAQAAAAATRYAAAAAFAQVQAQAAHVELRIQEQVDVATQIAVAQVQTEVQAAQMAVAQVTAEKLSNDIQDNTVNIAASMMNRSVNTQMTINNTPGLDTILSSTTTATTTTAQQTSLQSHHSPQESSSSTSPSLPPPPPPVSLPPSLPLTLPLSSSITTLEATTTINANTVDAELINNTPVVSNSWNLAPDGTENIPVTNPQMNLIDIGDHPVHETNIKKTPKSLTNDVIEQSSSQIQTQQVQNQQQHHYSQPITTSTDIYNIRNQIPENISPRKNSLNIGTNLQQSSQIQNPTTISLPTRMKQTDLHFIVDSSDSTGSPFYNHVESSPTATYNNMPIDQLYIVLGRLQFPNLSKEQLIAKIESFESQDSDKRTSRSRSTSSTSSSSTVKSKISQFSSSDIKKTKNKRLRKSDDIKDGINSNLIATGTSFDQMEAIDSRMGNTQDNQDSEKNEVHRCMWRDCSKVYTTLELLIAHVGDTHIGSGKSTYLCDWEGCTRNLRPFTKRHKMCNHLRTHTGERPYACNVNGCGKKFSRPDSLTTHKKTHSNHRPYVCQHKGCSKAYYHSRSLQLLNKIDFLTNSKIFYHLRLHGKTAQIMSEIDAFIESLIKNFEYSKSQRNQQLHTKRTWSKIGVAERDYVKEYAQ